MGNAFHLLQDAQSSDSESTSKSTSSDSSTLDRSSKSNHDQVKKSDTNSDEEFAELERQYSANLKINTESQTNASLIDANWLDPSVELKRKFSGKNHSDLKPKPFTGKLVSMINKTWRPFSPESIGLQMLKNEDGTFYYQSNHKYTEQYTEFESIVGFGDISLVIEFLRKYPNNPDALLCVADASTRFGMQIEGTSAIGLYQRVIQIMERLYHADFKLTESKLPYINLHNRKFHLALFRYVQVLIKQGCWRTALQVNTALNSLDAEDPLGSCLFTEFLKAQCKENVENSFNQLLTLHSPKMFTEYVERDPWLISELAKALGLDKPVIVEELLEDNVYNAAIQLRAKLFAARNAPLWKPEQHLNWFKSQLPKVDLRACESNMSGNATIAVYRHAILSDIKVNFSLPREITDAIGGNLSSHDPIPPEDFEVTLYDRGGFIEQARTLFRYYFYHE